MWNRIDRYISGMFWLYFAGGLLVFSTIFLAVDAMGAFYSYQNLSTSSLIQYYAYYLPEIVYRLVPMACLLSTVFTISTLNKNNELVALYSMGLGLARVTAPILFWVAVVSLGNFYLSDGLLPNFIKQKNYIFYHEIKQKPSMYSVVKNERIWYRSKDTIFNIKTLNERTHTAEGLTLYYFSESWDLIQMITAKQVSMLGQNWELQNGSVTIFTEDSSFPLTSDFKTKKIVMGEEAGDLSSTAQAGDVLSLKELSNFIEKNKEAGLDTVRYEVDYHSKYGYAFAAIVMSLLGIPFSVTRARSGGAIANVGICLGLVFLYWIFYSSSLTMGNYGYLPPFLAAWTPNFIMGGLSVYLIRK